MHVAIVGLAGTAVLVGVVDPLLPDTTLPPEARPYMWGGVATALCTSLLGGSLVAVGAYRPPEDPRNSTGFLRAVVLDFALQVLALAGGVAVMYLSAVKFQNLAAFGVAFAVVATVFRSLGMVVISRALSARAKYRRAQSGSTGTPQTLTQNSQN